MPDYQFVADGSLAPGWAYFIDGEDAICFTLDDWAEDREMIGPEVGVIHMQPDDFAELRMSIGTRH